MNNVTFLRARDFNFKHPSAFPLPTSTSSTRAHSLSFPHTPWPTTVTAAACPNTLTRKSKSSRPSSSRPKRLPSSLRLRQPRRRLDPNARLHHRTRMFSPIAPILLYVSDTFRRVERENGAPSTSFLAKMANVLSRTVHCHVPITLQRCPALEAPPLRSAGYREGCDGRSAESTCAAAIMCSIGVGVEPKEACGVRIPAGTAGRKPCESMC